MSDHFGTLCIKGLSKIGILMKLTKNLAIIVSSLWTSCSMTTRSPSHVRIRSRFDGPPFPLSANIINECGQRENGDKKQYHTYCTLQHLSPFSLLLRYAKCLFTNIQKQENTLKSSLLFKKNTNFTDQ